MEEVKLCGFTKGKGLSHADCMKEAGPLVVDPKKEEKPDFTCTNCGGHRLGKGEFNVNCLDKEAGRNFKTVSLWCADCGAKLDIPKNPIGKEDFKETAEMLKKLEGI